MTDQKWGRDQGRTVANGKYTNEVHRKLVQASSSGMMRTRMHKLVPCSSSTFNDWMKLGTRGVEPYASLIDEMEVSEAQLELALLQAKRRLALGLPHPEGLRKPDLQAAQWMLERRFGYSKKVDIVHSLAAPPPIDLSLLTEDEFLALGVQLQALPDNGAAEHIIIDVPERDYGGE